MNLPPRLPAAAALAAIVALATLGCAGPSGPHGRGAHAGPGGDAPEAATQSQQRAFAARGYNPARQLTWHEQPVSLATPTGVVRGILTRSDGSLARVPLVLYLPGLGEPASAGERWRHAWAASGVAVLSVQLLDDDANAFRSDLARDGDFTALGRQRYGDAAMRERLRALRAVLAEVRRRADAREQPFAGIDAARIVVAGFDLGAYTAMVLAGEQVSAEGGPDPAGPMIAVLALSPFADVAAGGLETRYAGIRVPVLSITGDGDSDPLGLVRSPTQRQAPYAHIKAADNWLLWVYGLNHERLSGGELHAAANAAPAREGDAVPAEPRGRSQRGARERRGAGGNAGAGGGIGDARGAPPAADPALALIAVEQVSVAFLDALVQRDDLARNWLAGHAAGWLHGVGELHAARRGDAAALR